MYNWVRIIEHSDIQFLVTKALGEEDGHVVVINFWINDQMKAYEYQYETLEERDNDFMEIDEEDMFDVLIQEQASQN